MLSEIAASAEAFDTRPETPASRAELMLMGLSVLSWGPPAAGAARPSAGAGVGLRAASWAARGGIDGVAQRVRGGVGRRGHDRVRGVAGGRVARRRLADARHLGPVDLAAIDGDHRRAVGLLYAC